MPKIKIHPLFIALAAVTIALGESLAFLSAITAVLLHELAHAAAAKLQGFRTGCVTLMPYGAVLNCDDKLDSVSEVIVAAAGPAANFCLALFTAGIWWLAPETFNYTAEFYKYNIFLGFFNLLPAFPLDGSRIVKGFCKNTARTIKILKICGIILSVILICVFFASLADKPNPTMAVMGVFLLIGALTEPRRQMYEHVFKNSPLTKNYELGVKECVEYVSRNTTLRRLLRTVDSRHIKIFVIVNERGKPVKRISEEELMTYATAFPLSARVGDIAGKNS